MGRSKVGLTFSEGRGLRILGSKDQALEGSEEGVGHFFIYFFLRQLDVALPKRRQGHWNDRGNSCGVDSPFKDDRLMGRD